jgi:hypothetical protein
MWPPVWLLPIRTSLKKKYHGTFAIPEVIKLFSINVDISQN